MFRLSKYVVFLTAVMVMSIMCCNDNNSNDNDKANPLDILPEHSLPISRADLIGNWMLIKEVEGTDTETFDSTYLLIFNENEMISYEKNVGCVTYDYSNYTLNGDQFNSHLSYDGTKISIQNYLLIMAVSNSEGSYAAYYKRYSGPTPPLNWPKALCDNSAPVKP
jgi:hypothetical protein